MDQLREAEALGTRISEVIAPVFYPLWQDVKAEGHREYWLKGGRGSAKSSFIALAIVCGLLRRPGANAIVYRRVAATLRESVYEQVIWAINLLGLRPWFELRLSPLEIRCRTGQRILFRGADDPMKSKSIKLARGFFGYLWFEELAEFDGMESVRTIKASVLRGEGRGVTFYSYNPPMSARSWVNAEALTPREDRLVHESCYTDLPPEWLGADFIAEAEALRRANERAWRHMYLGEVTGTGGQVFDNLRLEALPDEVEGMRCNGLDFGFASDPDAFTRWAYSRRERRLYALEEFFAAHALTDALAERVRKGAGREVVWCDPAEPRMIAELQRRGLNAVAARKGPGSVNAGIRWLQDLNAIVIDPARTPNIAREFTQYEYRRDKNGNFLPDVPDRDNHTIDSCRYALEREIMTRRARTRGDLY